MCTFHAQPTSKWVEKTMCIVSIACSRCHFFVDSFRLSGPVSHSMESQSSARTPQESHVRSEKSEAFQAAGVPVQEVEMARPGASASSVTQSLHAAVSGLMHLAAAGPAPLACQQQPSFWHVASLTGGALRTPLVQLRGTLSMPVAHIGSLDAG